MANMIDVRRARAAALDEAETFLKAAEECKRDFTASERIGYEAAMKKAGELELVIKAKEGAGTIRAVWGNKWPGFHAPLGAPDETQAAFASPALFAETRKPEYNTALHAFLKTGGKAVSDELLIGADGQGGYYFPGSERYTRQRLANGSFPKMSAATYEGTGGNSDGAGGYAVSIPTEQLIVPLALPDLGIFDASMVIPTSTDIKIPQQASFGTSALKAESTGTIAQFGGTDPTLGQITLSAFMAGALRLASWELLQDVQAFQQFIVDDLLKGQLILEDQLLATGTGVNQAQGIFGNTGNGTGTPYQLTGAVSDGALLLDALFDVGATLKAQYHSNASWIMSRATGLTIRRAQMQANLFAPVATVDRTGPNAF